MAGDGINRVEPSGEADVAAMENRAGGDRGLAAAGGAFIGEALGVERPGLSGFTAWADEAIRPAPFEEEAGAGGVVGEPLVECGSEHRPVVFPAARHENKMGT